MCAGSRYVCYTNKEEKKRERSYRYDTSWKVRSIYVNKLICDRTQRAHSGVYLDRWRRRRRLGYLNTPTPAIGTREDSIELYMSCSCIFVLEIYHGKWTTKTTIRRDTWSVYYTIPSSYEIICVWDVLWSVYPRCSVYLHYVLRIVRTIITYTHHRLWWKRTRDFQRKPKTEIDKRKREKRRRETPSRDISFKCSTAMFTNSSGKPPLLKLPNYRVKNNLDEIFFFYSFVLIYCA